MCRPSGLTFRPSGAAVAVFVAVAAMSAPPTMNNDRRECSSVMSGPLAPDRELVHQRASLGERADLHLCRGALGAGRDVDDHQPVPAIPNPRPGHLDELLLAVLLVDPHGRRGVLDVAEVGVADLRVGPAVDALPTTTRRDVGGAVLDGVDGGPDVGLPGGFSGFDRIGPLVDVVV